MVNQVLGQVQKDINTYHAMGTFSRQQLIIFSFTFPGK